MGKRSNKRLTDIGFCWYDYEIKDNTKR